MNNIELFDTHAHIHFPDYGLDMHETWQSAQAHGVTRMLAVGCRLEDSILGIELAQQYDAIWSTIGIHPHEAEDFLAKPNGKIDFENLLKDKESNEVVAIGEIGLDFYYNHSGRDAQIELLNWQLDLAEQYDLPVIFHVRDAFSDFWPLFDQHNIKKGLIHSFTGVESDVVQILKRNLCVGLNGIMTFTKVEAQLEAAKAIPIGSLVLETDAPYLTPKPFRGNICKPEHVRNTAEFLAELRGETFEELATQTTKNAQRLFNVN